MLSRDRRSEKIFRRLFEANIIGVIFADVHGTISHANDLFLQMVGYDRADLPLRWDEMTPPEWRDLDEAKVQELAATGVAAPWEKEYVRQDGNRVPVLAGAALLEGTDGDCVCYVLDLSERKRAESELVEHQEQLRALDSELALAEERERRRIARGLHDQIGHPLAVAQLRLGELLESQPSADKRRAVEEVHDLVAQAIEESRSLTFELSSPVLYELGLEPALRSLGQRIAESNGLRFDFASDRRPKPLTEDTQVKLYRVVEELLVNVVKHARARRARVAVSRIGDDVRITVEDDGVGLDASALGAALRPTRGLGLFGARERLDHIGGRLDIDGAPSSGTRVVVVAPLARDDQL